MKLSDFRAYSVVCEGLLYLAGDVAVHKTEAIEKKAQHDQHHHSNARDSGNENNMAPSEVIPTPSYRGFFLYTHNLQSPTRLLGTMNSRGRDRKLRSQKDNKSHKKI